MLRRDDVAVGGSTPAAASPPASELVKVVQQLWPEGLVWEDDLDEASVASMAYAFVPSRRAARFLVPLRNRASAGRTLRKYSTALQPREIAQRTAISWAFRLGGSAALRDRVSVLGEHRALRTWLSDWFGTPVTFSISIGTARVNRKPVLQVFDRRGETLAYAKLGSTAQVIGDVQAEARALELVHPRLPDEIVTPRVLGTGTWEGSFVLMLSPLQISMWQSARGRHTPPTRHMQLLNETFAEPDRLLADTPMWQRLRSDVTDEADAGLVDLVDELERRSEARPVRVGAWHGDWTSWNMARRGAKVLLWDWERFEQGMPAGMDHCHFLVNAATRERGFEVPVILGAVDGLRPAGQHVTSADLVVGGYLARLAQRYSAAARGPGGEIIAERAHILRESLQTWLARGRRP